MLTRAREGRAKFSTARFRPRTRADNRGMTGELARFLTLADTAEVLAISLSQAYALVRSGELPAIKVGGSGHWRVERTVLQAYIDGKYEENRRRALWQQAQFADIPELFVDNR